MKSNKLNIGLGAAIQGRAIIFLQDKISGVQTKVGEKNNLVLDVALNALRLTGNSYPNILACCKVGSGTNANEFNFAGSAIFTQVTTTITATSGVFTSAMVGAIFKYGATGTSNGAEQYISAFISATQVTVSGAGMAVVTPTAGAVWMVQQTSLQTFSFGSTTYQTTGNGTTYSGNVVTFQRTYVFPAQGSSYNVNEVGYYNGNGSGLVYGRIVLGSTVVVPTTSFLVVTLQLSVTQTPATITAVGNVGTNFNTAGNAAINFWSLQTIIANGSGGTINPGFSGSGNTTLLDNSNPTVMAFVNANVITQSAAISSGSATSTAVSAANSLYSFTMGSLVAGSNPVGVGTVNTSFSFTTAGETVYALLWCCNSTSTKPVIFSIVLTTPVVLPVGTFQGNATLMMTFSRTLVN